VLPLLSPGIRAIVPDQRGHGASDKPLDGYAMRQLALDALGLLDAAGVDRAVVAGHSMGGFVAQHLAALAPDRVSRLVLVGTAADPRTDSVGEMRETIDALEDPVDQLFIRDFQAGTIHQDVPEAFFERVVAESSRLPARVWKALYAGFMDHEPAVTAHVACPVRVLWGNCDQIFGWADQDLLVRRFPRAILSVVPDIGHALHWEAPEELASALQ
jgi:pimeloyl-ACP methyl ester carboxylesterase